LIQRLTTPHGLCVLVEVDDLESALATLPAEEQAHANALAELRRREHVAGRAALHHGLGDFSSPILSDDRGAPIMPAGWLGSVSHKAARAGALVAPASLGGYVGLDLEAAAPPKVDIARRILTPRELGQLPANALERGRATTLRFAIKEAIYKAIDPMLRRYVGFTEVELEIAGDAIAVTTQLPLAIEATWREHEGFWLATARATRAC
jgi:4'-phosphopantetheinyl transferase EntD